MKYFYPGENISLWVENVFYVCWNISTIKYISTTVEIFPPWLRYWYLGVNISANVEIFPPLCKYFYPTLIELYISRNQFIRLVLHGVCLLRSDFFWRISPWIISHWRISHWSIAPAHLLEPGEILLENVRLKKIQPVIQIRIWNKQPGFHSNRLYYINNALWIIQPGVEIPCFIFGLPWYIVQYTPYIEFSFLLPIIRIWWYSDVVSP